MPIICGHLRLWRAGQDSNPRLQAPEACALSWLGVGRNYAFYTRPYPPDIQPIASETTSFLQPAIAGKYFRERYLSYVIEQPIESVLSVSPQIYSTSYICTMPVHTR